LLQNVCGIEVEKPGPRILGRALPAFLGKR